MPARIAGPCSARRARLLDASTAPRIPEAPFVGGTGTSRWIGIEEPSRVALHDVAVSKLGRQRGAEALPMCRERGAEPSPEDPVEVLAPRGRDSPQRHLREALGLPPGEG